MITEIEQQYDLETMLRGIENELNKHMVYVSGKLRELNFLLEYKIMKSLDAV